MADQSPEKTPGSASQAASELSGQQSQTPAPSATAASTAIEPLHKSESTATLVQESGDEAEQQHAWNGQATQPQNGTDSTQAPSQQQQQQQQQRQQGKHRSNTSIANAASTTALPHRPAQHHKQVHHRAHLGAAHRPQVARNPSQRNIMRLQALKTASAASGGAPVAANTGNATDGGNVAGAGPASGTGGGGAAGAPASGHVRQNSDPTAGQGKRHHVRKKSAPVGSVTDAAQPEKESTGGSASSSGTAVQQGHQNQHQGHTEKQAEKPGHVHHAPAAHHHVAHPIRPGMRRNFSTPVFRHQRNASTLSAKKGAGPSALATAQPMTRTKSHDRPTSSSGTVTAGRNAVAGGGGGAGDGRGTGAGGAARGKASIGQTAAATAAPREKKTVPKKTVGFQLSAESTDESEWEDNNSPSGTTSPASTRQNSVVAGAAAVAGAGGGTGNPPGHEQQLQQLQQLLNHGTYRPGARSPLAQTQTQASGDGYLQQTLPQQQLQQQRQGQCPQLQLQVQDHQQQLYNHQRQQGIDTQPTTPVSEHPRFLYNKKAPPSISSVSISAHAPLASAQPPSMAPTATTTSAATPTTATVGRNYGASSAASAQGASSSVEGGVSRFLTNGPTGASSIATDTSVSPYHTYRTPTATRPTTPGYSGADSGVLKSPASRYRVSELASRTQQRLWLDRDSMTPGGRPATAAAAGGLDGDFRHRGGYASMHAGGAGPNGGIDPSMIGVDDREANAAAFAAMNPAKRNRKLYDKYTTEFSVVHRFRDPVADSFKRLQLLPKSDRDAAASKDTGGIPRDYIGAHLSPSTAHFALQAQQAASGGAPLPSSPSIGHQSPVRSRRPSRSVTSTSSKYGSQVRFKTMSNNNQDDRNSTDYSSEDQGDSLVMHKKQQKTGPEARGGRAGPRRLPLRGPPGMGGVIQEEGGYPGAGGTGGDQSDSQPVERRPTDEEMLLRRIWEWRDMAVVGGAE